MKRVNEEEFAALFTVPEEVGLDSIEVILPYEYSSSDIRYVDSDLTGRTLTIIFKAPAKRKPS